MKIGILSRNRKLYSTSRLVQAAQQRGHEVRVINHLRCYMNIASFKPGIHYDGKVLEGFDAIIPRIGASVTFYGTAVVRQFEMMGTFSLNESVAISRSRDKLRCLQLLSRKGIGLPVTGFAHSPDARRVIRWSCERWRSTPSSCCCWARCRRTSRRCSSHAPRCAKRRSWSVTRSGPAVVA